MKKLVQARLDTESAAMLQDLTNRLGWTQSEAVREGIRLLASAHGRTGKRRIIGLGKFNSGIPDLATNKKHLEGFGR